MITDKIFNLDSFKRQFEALLILSVYATIPNLNKNEESTSQLSKIDWNNLLGIASLLSYSADNYQHLDAALRIAQTCLTQESTTESQRNASAIILENLTNKPAIKLALERNYLYSNYKEKYPLSFKLQTIHIEIENSIFIRDILISLNKFQKTVHDIYENNETISISAPTSAGKSFILCTILLEEILNGIKNIVYVVPTRALISQVEFDIRELLKSHKVENVDISTVPQNEVNENKSNVFVFTQERLHWFLIDNSIIKIDLLIIDEAHKIEDDNRGILLQQKIEEVVKRFANVKVYFSSPFTSNPEILLDNVKNESKKEKVNTQFISVNQNLIFATQLPKKTDKWELSLCLIDKTISLGTLPLKDRPGSSEFKKIAFIAESFSANKGGNIIYSNGAADSEKTAMILYDLLKEETQSNKIYELIKIIQKTIHRDYILATVLKKGIAFHYGNMPLLIRQEIESLFKEGDIKYLICTSTLLEGINLPTKSIFIRKPKRGRDHPLDQNDFWNLAGRAGRWGKEYSGNIICIEPQDWEIKPNPNKSKQIIKRAIDEIENNGTDLLNYIKTGSPRKEASTKQNLEFAFGYYYSKFLDNELMSTNAFFEELIILFEELRYTILIPDYIIKRNPGISPIAQQTLYNYFNENIDNIEKLIPIYPEAQDAVNDYSQLIGIIGTTLADYPEQLNVSNAILLVNWMSGRPLSVLISSSFKSYQNNPKYRKAKTLHVVIREVMEKIETFVRFRFAKDSSCYVDILRYFLELNGKQDLITQIPQLNLWLEFGVSQKTHLSLLSLGLSRNTVIELSGYITNSTMSKNESVAWLKSQNLEQLDLSPIIIEDIRRIL